MPRKWSYRPFISSISIILILMGIFVLGSCHIFRQANEYQRFIHSRFTIKNGQLLSVGKVNLSNKNSYNDLNFGEIVSLGMQMLKGNLPAMLQLTIEAYNPASERAAISGTDWVLLSKADTIAKGTLNKPITIPAQTATRFPVTVRFNLGRLITSGSLQQILKAAMGEQRKAAYEKLHLTFKIRPWYRSGNKIKKAPVYFTVHPR